MTTDLWMLVWSAVLCVLIPLAGLSGLLWLPGGSAWGFGNRDDPFPAPNWIARNRRAHSNMVENLAPFACLVLVAHVGGKASGTTALGSEIFFVARIAHAIIYTIGIPVLRTLVFGVSIAGEVMILLQILR
jgi:uncharacterized MAPEG superfamily protein